MAKRRTKAEKFDDYYSAFKQITHDHVEKVKRIGARDGSISTHPTVDVSHIPEALVLRECLDWLKRHKIFHNRHDAGSFMNDRGQWGTYGIKHAGDIIGILPNGTHFEIECKHGSGGRLSKGQQKRWRDVVDTKGIYLVIHGVDELEYYFGDLI